MSNLTEREKWLMQQAMSSHGYDDLNDWLDGCLIDDGCTVEDLLSFDAPSDWISVETDMPETGTTVIVDGGIAQYMGKYGGWYSLTGIEYPGRPTAWDVTHWMPLPDKPTPTK